MGRRNHALDGGAHWRHLANTIEPFGCGGDAALCQVTLTICYYKCHLHNRHHCYCGGLA